MAMKNMIVDIQHACEEALAVDNKTLISWVKCVLTHHDMNAELTVRLSSIDEITALNLRYRHKNKPTNVLAFPAHVPQVVQLEQPFLGDIVIAPQVLQQESTQLEVPLIDHWAHIVIHGVLHLLGYDHIEEEDAEIMQAMETKLLLQLGFNNPYQRESTADE